MLICSDIQIKDIAHIIVILYGIYSFFEAEGQAWYHGESCFTESQGRRFEAASPHLRGEGLPRFSPSPNSTHVGAPALGLSPF